MLKIKGSRKRRPRETEYSPICMDIDKRRAWFDTLVTDDVATAENILKNSSNEEKYLLINCPFDYNIAKSKSRSTFNLHEHCLKIVDLPFHIVVCFNSNRMVELLLKNRVNILCRNSYGNILHSCVVTAFSRPQLQDSICEMITWLHIKLQNNNFKELLFQENNDGLRPLEFAAQQGCLKLMKVILEMKGHAETENFCALFSYRYHDITEYELGERHSKSPIHMLAYLDKKKLKDTEINEVVMSPLILSWINGKIKSNIIPIFGLFLIRFVFIMLYFFLSFGSNLSTIHERNEQNDIPMNYTCSELSLDIDKNVLFGLHIMLLVIAIVIMILDVVTGIKSSCGKNNIKRFDLNGSKSLMTSTMFYKWINISLTGCITVVTLDGLLSSVIDSSDTLNLVRHIAQNLTPILCLWTLCNFLQLLPQIGSSIVSIQGMVLDVMEFMLLYGLVLLPFVQVFETFILFNSQEGCIEEFSSPYETAYTLFRIMLNMVDLTKLKVQHHGLLYMLHALYIFIVGVMLLNFLIAIMSSSASRITENGNVILKINQLALVVRVEDLVFSYCKGLYLKLRKYGFTCSNGKVYIRSVGCRLNELRIK